MSGTSGAARQPQLPERAWVSGGENRVRPARCANWLRYGIWPKGARPGLVPGRCKGKAHNRSHLGYAGCRVLTSRRWSGKTLADHRTDRKNWLTPTLGVSATDPARYTWEPVKPGDPDHMEPARRLLHVVADRQRYQANAVGQAEAGESGDRSDEGHAQAAKSVASHPVSSAPILTAVHPEPPGTTVTDP